MYLAPLNYDRYFKKVFSELKIAKKFLEDFLDVEIQDIKAMPVKQKISDAAQYVEFDFRCKIDNSYVIIDMQQWYKPDVVFRFYTYHAINTALQLEKLPEKRIGLPNSKIWKVKDYTAIVPVVTIIWMVDDNLGFMDDYVGFTMLPEKMKSFFEETDIWKNNNIKERMKEISEMADNDTKSLSFLQKNRLLFAFQKNIVKNKRFSKYSDWFNLAQKTLNRLNEKSDFDEYRKDNIFAEIIRRLLRSNLNEDDLSYINNYATAKQEAARYDKGIREEGRLEGKIEGIKEEREKNEQTIKTIKREKEKAEREKEQEKFKSSIMKLYYKEQKSIEDIANILNCEKDKIDEIIEKP